MSEQPQPTAASTTTPAAPTPAAMPAKKTTQSAPKKAPAKKSAAPKKTSVSRLKPESMSLQDFRENLIHMFEEEQKKLKNERRLEELHRDKADKAEEELSVILALASHWDIVLPNSPGGQAAHLPPASVPPRVSGSVQGPAPAQTSTVPAVAAQSPTTANQPASPPTAQGAPAPNTGSPSFTDKIKIWFHEKWDKFIEDNRPSSQHSQHA